MATHSKTVERIPKTLQGPIVSTAVPALVPLWVEKLAWLMDRSIPIGKGWSIGLDGIVGLFPGVGDLAGAFISALIVASATQVGLPRAAVARMMANVAVDTLLGGIPLVGDLFDFAFKANTKNLKIYQDHLQGTKTDRAQLDIHACRRSGSAGASGSSSGCRCLPCSLVLG